MSPYLKKSKGYQGITMPITLTDIVREIVLTTPQYRSISEFVREALREKINRDDMLSLEQINNKLDELLNIERSKKQ